MRCLALFSGGLDSQIAVRMMQRQGIEVVGVYVETPFTLPAGSIAPVAEKLGIPLHVLPWHDDYLAIVRQPRFGFTEGMAPCLDCRSGMLRRVHSLLAPLNASFLISGEVVGQRPSSLRLRDLETMAYHGGVEDLLLRPLSAQLLPETLPERQGWVDRSLLHAWQGKGRKTQLALAREEGLSLDLEQAARCKLLDATYAARLRRLLQLTSSPTAFQLASLGEGRHFQLAGGTHLVVSKNAQQADLLRNRWELQPSTSGVLLQPSDFRGPLGFLTGLVDDDSLAVAASILAAHAKDAVLGQSSVAWTSQALSQDQGQAHSKAQGHVPVPANSLAGEAQAWK
jgi:tRNA-specific 2-thiouridylase